MYTNILVLDNGTEIQANQTGSTITNLVYTATVSSTTDLCPGAACAAKIEFTVWVQPGSYLAFTSGTRVKYYQEDAGGTRTPVGTFWAVKPTKQTRNSYKVYAYDAVSKLDGIQSTWLRSIQDDFPMSLWSFAQAVAQQCGVTLANSSLPRSGSYQVQAFYGDNLTGRQLLGWVAEASCTFLRATPSGGIEFAWYTTNTQMRISPDGQPVNGVQAVAYRDGGLSYEDYQTATIDKVQIKQSDDDVGVIYPANEKGTNALVIKGNLLLTTSSAELLQPVAQSIYTAMQGITYTPLKVSLFSNGVTFAPGQIVTVKDSQGNILQTYVMTVQQSGAKISLESTGNASRDGTAAVNEEKLNLNGKILEISATVDGLTIKASELSGDFSKLQQSVDSISLGVTSQKQYEDILGDSAWTEPYGSASISDGVLTVSGQSDKESGASVYVPSQNLAALAGKYIRVSLEYKVTQQYSGGFFRVTLWYVYETESGGGSYVNIIDPGETVAPMNDWKTFSFLYLAKDDVVTKLQLNPRAQSGASGTVEVRNVTIAAEVGVQNTVSILKDGIEISSATLDTQPTLKDFTALKLDQSKLSLTVVKDGEVRSKFAADDSSVTIQSGVITFASNTLVVDSENFQLKQDGTVQITGTFTSLSGIDKAYIGSGQLHLERQTNDGIWRPTLYSYSEGQNAALGHLLMYGPGSEGNQIPMASFASSFTGGEFWLYYANSKPMFQITQHSNGGPYFSLNDTSWNAIGKWLMDNDGRGHLTTPIVELEKLKAYGETHTAQWVYISSIGRRVLCSLD